jgi:beta-lactamase regulating signal transducer with metallopeptidase domain
MSFICFSKKLKKMVLLVKITLAWCFFALFYSLLLQKETFFKVNRAYLLLTIFAGILMPIWFEYVPVQSEIEQPIVVLNNVAKGIGQVRAIEQLPRVYGITDLLWAAYFIGLFYVLFRAIYGIWEIFLIKIKAQHIQQFNQYTLIENPGIAQPFSFFKWIFIPENLQNKPEKTQILIHESTHARELHSADVLIMEVLCIVFWFHPLIYWYRRSLRNVHEYLADDAVAKNHDKKQYGLLLIQQAQSGPALVIANHFVTSQLKQRIVMLTKKASTPSIAGWKYGLIVPIFTLLALLFQQNFAFAQRIADPNRVAQVRQSEKNGWMTVDTVITFNPETYEETVKIVTNDSRPFIDSNNELVYQEADIMPSFPGGDVALAAFLKSNLKRPKEASPEQTIAVYVNFQVSKTGKISMVKTDIYQKTPAQKEYEEEVLRIISLMPDWLPGEHRGEKVNSKGNMSFAI